MHGSDGSVRAVPLDDDLTLALSLADRADEITMARFGAVDLQIDTKPDLTPVTDADREVERMIRAQLALERPEDDVLGEEFGETTTARTDPRRLGTREWIIDPIDGTKNFVRGVPAWATLIALLIDGEPVLGVVSAPSLARRWWAATGFGAWATFAGSAPRRLNVSAVAEIRDASISYSSMEGWAQIGRLDEFVSLLRDVWRSRAFGDFWSYMLVAEGSVDLAAEPELSLWDMAALAPIVTEAGGVFTGIDGRPGIRSGNAAASNGLLHDAFIAAIGTT
jgi:histidinol-phosphatase